MKVQYEAEEVQNKFRARLPLEFDELRRFCDNASLVIAEELLGVLDLLVFICFLYVITIGYV